MQIVKKIKTGKGVNSVVVKNKGHKKYLDVLVNKKNNEAQNQKNSEKTD